MKTTMTDDDIFIYGDERNEVIHLIRSFERETEEGDYMHSCMSWRDFMSLIENMDEMQTGQINSLESIAGPITCTKIADNMFTFQSATFNGGWIINFCSLSLTTKAMKTIGKILTEKSISFLEERRGPIIINGGEWYTYDMP